MVHVNDIHAAAAFAHQPGVQLKSGTEEQSAGVAGIRCLPICLSATQPSNIAEGRSLETIIRFLCHRSDDEVECKRYASIEGAKVMSGNHDRLTGELAWWPCPGQPQLEFGPG
jgi:hypothetical protein